MTEQNRLDALLLRYEELRAQNTPLSPEELCLDCPEFLPELKRQIRVLESMNALLGGAESEEASAALTPPDPASAGLSVPRPAQALSTASRYQVLRFHAKGGLGEVHVAWDEELHREVALKRLQSLHARNPYSRTRFLREAEITSRLEHPNIVPVHSIGQDADGTPFYAMRFIQGQTLQEAIQQFHAAAGSGSTPGERHLALRQLLSRLVAVCNTIAYAHRKDIVHRDIKPDNIMLGPYGETLVVDWGLAKDGRARERESEQAPQGAAALEPGPPALTRSASPTRTGVVIGTPAYMSPEQAAGRWDQVGPASDVYSLGATLHVLLTGQPPFQGSQVGELVDKVKAGQFVPPRQRNKDIPRALEAICLKAMARAPEEHYRTALHMAVDLEHWLADEPVSAWPEPWTAGVRRWLGRHRTLASAAVAAAGVAGAALVIGLMLLAEANFRERQQRQLAEQQRIEAEKQKQKSDAHFRLARTAVDDFHTKVSESQEFKTYGLEPLRQKLLESAVEFYQQFVQEEAGDLTLQVERGWAYRRLGNLHRLLGHHEQSEEAYRQALAISQQVAEAQPQEAHYQRDLANIHVDLGVLYYSMRRTNLAKEALEQARAIFRSVAREHPAVTEYQVQLADSHHKLAIVHRATGGTALAEQAFGEVRAIFQHLADTHPNVPEYLRKLAASDYSLGSLFYDTGRKELAEHAYQRALELRQRLADAHPQVPDYQSELSDSHTMLGILYNRTGRTELAKEAYQQAQVILQRLADAHPQVPEYQKDLAGSHNNLAILDKEAGRTGSAEKAFLQAQVISQRLADAHPQVPEYQLYLAASHNNLGGLYRRMGRFDLAEQAYRQAGAIYEHLANAHKEVVDYTVQFGGSYWNLGHLLKDDLSKPEESLTCYAAGIQPLEALLQKDPRQSKAREVLLNLYGGRAVALAMLDRHAEAEHDLQRADEIDQGQSRGLMQFYGGSDIRHFRARVLVLAGDHARATAEADDLVKSKALQGGQFYDLAFIYALATAAGQQDAKLSEADRAALSERYAARAVELFKKAQAAGHFRNPAVADRLRNHKDLAVLRSREDFQNLVKELEENR